MSFIGNALGVSNGYVAQSGAGDFSTQIQNQDNANLKATYANQETLAAQLRAQANGQGPNVAQLQLQQATDQNNQKAAGAAASQRGMNPALAQRMIAQQAANNNQNAAGQSGVLRAQQQLSAEGAASNVYGQEAGENVASENALTAAQTAANTTNAQTAANNTGLFGSIFAHGGEVKALPKHLQHLDIPTGDKIHPVHLAQGGLLGSNFSGSLMGLVKGLWAPGTAPTPAAAQQAGTDSFNTNFNDSPNYMNGISSSGDLTGGLGQSATGMGGMAGGAADAAGSTAGAEAATAGSAAATAEGSDSLLELAAAHGAKVPKSTKKVPAMISPGERFIPPHLVEAVRKGRLPASKAAAKVPGKPKVQGDSEQNDTVPAALAPGGVVIPRSKADNDADAREFLQAIAKEKEKKSSPSAYTKVLAARRKSA